MQVQFLAVDENEVRANYRLLQSSGALIGLQGLNSQAKVLLHFCLLPCKMAGKPTAICHIKCQFE